MKPQDLIKTSMFAWIGGLICFFFPFLNREAVWFQPAFSVNALSLMTRIGPAEAEMAEAPLNIYLWVAALMGVVGVCAAISCNNDWKWAKETGKPIIAVICGVVGLFCLYQFMSAYGISGDMMAMMAIGGFSVGWGRNFAMLCFLVATVCPLIACFIKEPEQTQGQAPDEQVHQVHIVCGKCSHAYWGTPFMDSVCPKCGSSYKNFPRE